MNSLSRICSIFVQWEGDLYIQRGDKSYMDMTLGKRCFTFLYLSFYISEIEMQFSRWKGLVKLNSAVSENHRFPLSKHELFLMHKILQNYNQRVPYNGS